MRQLFGTLLCLLTLTANAQKPVLKSFTNGGFIFGKMSDNGQWVTQSQEVDVAASPQLINLETYEVIDIQSDKHIAQHGVASLIDVTDDGNILVGCYEGCPAYYNRATDTWKKLSTQAGHVSAVTPDGHYAVGTCNNGGNAGEEVGWYTATYPKMWDLTTGFEVLLPSSAIPKVDPKGNTGGMANFCEVSPDGRFIIGNLFVDYPDYGFVVDRQTGSFTFIGYKANDNGGYQTTIQDLYFNEAKNISPNGEWVVCSGYFVTESEEYYAAVRYNLLTGETTAYTGQTDDKDMNANVIDNEGNVYGGTPMGTAVREFYVRSGNYWYSLRSVLSQKYGMDFETLTGFDNTGTPYGISADGLTFTAMVDPLVGQNLVMRMPENIVEVCKSLNLLGVYAISPASGACFSSLSQLTLTFDRDIEVVGAQTAAKFGSWSSLSTNGIYVNPTNPRELIVAFRSRTLTEGEEYTFTLPAGTICVAGDRVRTNDEITATYTGRANKPVQVLSTYPEEGGTVAKIDNSSSPVMLTMDCDVMTTDVASGAIFTSEGRKISALSVVCNGKAVALYPSTTQYLYADNVYDIVLNAGSLTDVTGGGSNEEFHLTLNGSYVREVSSANGTLFSDDFDNVSNSLAMWLLYEGDHLTPNEEMLSFEFTADDTPWNFSIHQDATSSDYCAASHSCYEPAGQSADWMLTPQIYIPDDQCKLTFQGQSYRNGCMDYLQVYVWPNDNVLSYVGDDDYAVMKAEGWQALNTQLSPGKSEDNIDGEWTDYEVDLSAFAGKNVYICFGNESRDQSMVFINNVAVSRYMAFTLSLSTPESVTAQESVVIAGRLAITDKTQVCDNIALTLKDADGKAVSSLAYENVSTEQALDFTFAEPLPLTVGETAAYSIDVALNGAVTTVSGKVNNLAFAPTKRVVLEEKTGITCGNCPQGILAIEKMEAIYGHQFIPISIHTYDNDPWGTGLSGYTNYLNLMAAPTAVVQRSTGILSPMTTDDNFEYVFAYNGLLWMDKVGEEMDKPATLDIHANVEYDEQTGVFEVPTTVRSALNATGLNINIFMVLMEDSLLNYQENYFAATNSSAFGDWGMGGKYGQSVALGVTHNDVARNCYGNTYAGTGGLLPQTMKAGHDYQPSSALRGELPANVENWANAKVCVMLIDANTDKVINACVAHFDPSRDEDGIQSVGQTTAATGAYNLLGQRVGNGYRGLAIINGKKIIMTNK